MSTWLRLWRRGRVRRERKTEGEEKPCDHGDGEQEEEEGGEDGDDDDEGNGGNDCFFESLDRVPPAFPSILISPLPDLRARRRTKTCGSPLPPPSKRRGTPYALKTSMIALMTKTNPLRAADSITESGWRSPSPLPSAAAVFYRGWASQAARTSLPP
ncbi:hypothetical protein HPP92_005131 [Vanilla planifolia]|uniref:Uncharacterized protein n=1 Tax=Vanilla planifolia TaxID=51239 RepID=A0A835VCX1_VANPL|nr:hypothetical protein HPP92_005131 [Vanilla planifolia]